MRMKKHCPSANEVDLPPKNWSRQNVRMWTEEGEELNGPRPSRLQLLSEK